MRVCINHNIYISSACAWTNAFIQKYERTHKHCKKTLRLHFHLPVCYFFLFFFSSIMNSLFSLSHPHLLTTFSDGPSHDPSNYQKRNSIHKHSAQKLFKSGNVLWTYTQNFKIDENLERKNWSIVYRYFEINSKQVNINLQYRINVISKKQNKYSSKQNQMHWHTQTHINEHEPWHSKWILFSL